MTPLSSLSKLIQLGTVKLSPWRHWIPIWSSLIAEKRGADTEWLRRWPRERDVSFPETCVSVTPTCTRALRRRSMVYHRLLFSNDPAFWLIGSSWSLMRSLNSGARKKPWRVGSSQPSSVAGKDRTHSCSRFPFLSFSLCCGSFFEDRSVRNGYCSAWLQRTRASSCHQDVAWWAWCWCWEYARVEWAFRVVQRSQWNKEKTDMRKW